MGRVLDVTHGIVASLSQYEVCEWSQPYPKNGQYEPWTNPGGSYLGSSTEYFAKSPGSDLESQKKSNLSVMCSTEVYQREVACMRNQPS
ncbi:hypothetical protein E2C01_075565 [Portunus trituberculatus]|uniref:Uncharacterized protein n=1 Tax=Portunus trituberculatus TaxID=210409 RepID=A0A5B7IG54_PORTR|nr:hypothetical protein [Portunus trituberculatus]